MPFAGSAAFWLAGQWGADTFPPTITVTTVTVGKISRVVGKDSTSVTFTANEGFVEYQIRRVTNDTDAITAGQLVKQGLAS